LGCGGVEGLEAEALDGTNFDEVEAMVALVSLGRAR
jgi:hypothetical protein